MANLTNPVATLAGFAIKHTTHGLQKSSQELATGIRSVEGNLVGYVVGSSLRSTETVLRAVSSSSGYGINMLSVAENSLTAVKNKVVELRGIIASANTPNGGTLTELDNLYRNGLKEAQRLLDQAVFDNRVLFNAATTLNIRVGEKITDTIATTLSDLRANTLNFRHTLDIVALDNTAPLGGGPLRLQWEAIGNVAVSNVAGVAQGAGNINALIAANMAVANATIAGGGLVVANGNYFNGNGGFIDNQVVGSILNTLQGINTTLAADTPGVLSVASIPTGNSGNSGQFVVGNTVSTAQQNQGIADGFMKAMETLLTSNLNNVVGQKESLRSAAENLDDLITVVNSGADSYLLTEYEESSKRFQAELLSLQGAISTIAQGARVASATLDLIKGQ